MPVGSELSRRAIWLPASVQQPAKIQQPACCRRRARQSRPPARFSCARSCSHLRVCQVAECAAVVFLASSSAVGLSRIGVGPVHSLTIGSGYLPPSLHTSCASSEQFRHDFQSLRASPGVGAFQCHCSQRPELTSEPSSSAKQVVGRRNTSVCIWLGSTSLKPPCSSRTRKSRGQRIHDDHRNFSAWPGWRRSCPCPALQPAG